MLSVVGEEFVAYAESVRGTYAPLIAIAKYDGSGAYREIVKEDLLRIDDAQSLPGGWLFRKTQSASSSWVRRFSLLRGEFLFFFHSPQNDKPVAIAPLEECTIMLPENSAKSFEETRSYRANEGFEFDIRHRSRPTVRLYALSEEERTEWLAMLRQRVEETRMKRLTQMHLEGTIVGSADSVMDNGSMSSAGLHPNFPAASTTITTANITVTSVKLSGVSLLPVTSGEAKKKHSQEEKHSQSDSSPTSLRMVEAGVTGKAINEKSADMSVSKSSAGASTGQKSTGVHEEVNEDDDDFDPLNLKEHIHQQLADEIISEYVDIAPAQAAMDRRHEDRADVSRLREKNLGFDVKLLEQNLQRRLSDQIEARDRENAARTKMQSNEALLQAQEEEDKNPVTLAEMFRLSLYFVDEEVAEDPQEGTPLQMPHLKGDAIEMMMMTVYRRYCGESGYMALENFIEFLDDSAILQTHVPHNENDEPIEEYVTLLDPVRLLTLVPRNIGFSSVQGYEAVTDKLMAAAEQDKFIINFSQFYLLMLRITQIVYADLYESDSTLAFNKFLLEIILPIYIWSNGRHKRGSRDVLVLEERILLLMTTYSPNLWRVFLTYAQDAVNKVPEINLIFPEKAQLNEKGMYRLPAAAPLRMKELGRGAMPESLFLTEAGCLRFARDYGITPYVVTQKQLREMVRGLNRQKIIVSSRLPVRDQLAVGPLSKAQINKSVRKERSFAPMKFGGTVKMTASSLNASVSRAAQPKNRGAGDDRSVVSARSYTSRRSAADSVGGRSVQPPLPTSPPPPTEDGSTVAGAVAEGELPPPPPPDSPPPLDEEIRPPPSRSNGPAVVGGISFSEFVELVARIAVVGLQQENYHLIFPTPFSKVLAMLTVWGIADLKKLEEVRIIHTDELY